jgi:predicted dehydrogenase
MHRITLLGTGFIGNFYTMTLNGRRSSDRVHAVYGRNEDHARQFAEQWHLPHSTADMAEAINHPETDVVVIGLPNHLHEDAVRMTAEAGKAVLCTKPLGRTAEEARRMLQAVEKAGVFAGYLEDLVYTPKTLKSLAAVRDGALGQVLWVRSRETHPGPHSPWFLDPELAGGGAIIDMGCHCVEIIRSFIGKRNRPVEVMCWADTLVHPIDAEDHGIGLVRFESGAVGQFEVSWAFRGGMDLRDEVSGTEGTIRMDHFLRTGFEVFSAGGRGGYVAEKAEQETGWLFPVGDEAREPTETFYDGYVVNAIVDASYRSAKSKLWEPIELKGWRGAKKTEKITAPFAEVDGQVLIKKERLPDGRTRMILKNKKTGRVSEKMVE